MLASPQKTRAEKRERYVTYPVMTIPSHDEPDRGREWFDDMVVGCSYVLLCFLDPDLLSLRSAVNPF